MDSRGILRITLEISRMTSGITKFELVLNKSSGLWKSSGFQEGFQVG
jgi:hypothetical protein